MFLQFNKQTDSGKTVLIHKTLTLLAGMVLLIGMIGCQGNDDLPPVITLIGEDTLFHVLNEDYNDPGATATDDVDGNMTSNIYVDNEVNEDRVGEYSVYYRVVDNAGNEAPEKRRVVYVYNEGDLYLGDYTASESRIFPGPESCQYPVFVWQDSATNNRLIFYDFACSSGRTVFADIAGTLLVVPFQVIQDSIYNMTLQGSGVITDTAMTLEYTRIDSTGTSLWNATFSRMK